MVLQHGCQLLRSVSVLDLGTQLGCSRGVGAIDRQTGQLLEGLSRFADLGPSLGGSGRDPLPFGEEVGHGDTGEVMTVSLDEGEERADVVHLLLVVHRAEQRGHPVALAEHALQLHRVLQIGHDLFEARGVVVERGEEVADRGHDVGAQPGRVEDRMMGDLVGDGPHAHLLVVEPVLSCEGLDIRHDEVAPVVIERRHADIELSHDGA